MAVPEGVYGVIAFFVFGFGMGVWSVYTGIKNLAMKRLIQDMPTSTIRSIAIGPVEVKGKVVAGDETLMAPFSGKKCVYYRYMIEEKLPDKDMDKDRWKTITKGEEGRQFKLKDSTGQVVVDPAGAKVEVPSDFSASSHIGVDPPERIMKFIKDNKLKFENFLGMNKTWKYTETRIEPGAELYVMAEATSNDDVEAGSAKQNADRILLKKGRVFYISNRSEKDVVKSFQFKGIGMIIVGGIFGFIFLMILFVMISALFH
jgi:hypothetical protein